MTIARRAVPRSSSPRRSPTPASSCCASASTSTSGWTGRAEELAERIGGYDGILIRSATQADRRPDRARRPAEGDRARRDRGRQRRRGGGDEARDHRRQRAAVEHRRGGGAHDRVDAGAGAQRPAGARVADGGAVGALAGSAAWRCMRRRSACSGSAGSASSWPRGPALRDAGRGVRPVRVAPSASASSGWSRRRRSAELYAQADFITLHLPKTPETRGLARRRGVRADAGRRAGRSTARAASWSTTRRSRLRWTRGKVAGAALDVFPSEPITDYPLFDGYPNVVVTPHLGASTTEAQDRAGVQTAEQVRRGADRRRRLDRGQHPGDPRGGHGACSARSCRSPAGSAGWRWRSPRAPSIDRVEIEYFGRIAERDTRLLTLAVLQRRARRAQRGGRQPRQRAERWPRSAASASPSARRPTARDFTDLVRVTIVCGARALPRRRHDARPPPPPAPARGVGPALQPAARRGRAPRAVPLPRPAGHDGPRRHRARRARREHLLRRRRPPAARARTAAATSSR